MGTISGGYGGKNLTLVEKVPLRSELSIDSWGCGPDDCGNKTTYRLIDMFRIFSAVSFLALVSACSSGTQPFDFGTTTDGTGTTTDGTGTTGTTQEEAAEATGGLDVGVALPDGTSSPTATDSIFRFESRDGSGGGLVSSVTYNAADDEFTVDNLGFDGANVYQRGTDVDTLGVNLQQYAVYEADEIAYDALDGDPIGQIVPYRAIVGVSKNAVGGEARTSFAIVRTGGYSNYGFGGFIYERNGGVTLPTTGQARFAGEYAGIRIFDNGGDLEYTTGDMTVDIDFRDFNANDAVKGQITNRLAFALDGTPISLGSGVGQLLAPNVNFVIVEGVQTLTDDGEISGTLNSSVVAGGIREVYETGTYYGVLAGDMTDVGDGGELVGIFVLESDDPRYEGATAQETGGFILYR